MLLRRPASAPDYPEKELERIQREHLAYHAGLREAGHVVTNGPVDGQPDPSLRGLAFYRTGSLERSRQLAEADPARGRDPGRQPRPGQDGRLTQAELPDLHDSLPAQGRLLGRAEQSDRRFRRA